MKLYEILTQLETLSPPAYAESWDNVGLLVGDENQEIQHILITLDASDSVIEQAVQMEADLILTHHPMIFHPVKQVNNHSMAGRRILKLAAHTIACYAMHTNFDIKGGMGQLAADRLELTDTRPLDVTVVTDGVAEGIGRVGLLPQPMSIRELAEQVKTQFGLKNVILYGDSDAVVQTIAICPGSGKSEIGHALEQHADILITGDIGHHEGLDAVDQGLPILDATHYGLEHIFIPFMEDYLWRWLRETGREKDIQITTVEPGGPGRIM